MEFNQLMNVEIPKLIENCSYDTDKYSIGYKYNGYKAELDKEEDGTLVTTVSATCEVYDKISGERITSNVELLDVPVKTNLGFKIGKAYKQILDIYKKAEGWYLLPGKPPTSGKPDNRLEDERAKLDFISSTLSLEFVYSNYQGENNMIRVGRKSQNTKKSNTVPLGIFLKAFTGKSYKELLNILGTNRYIIGSLRHELSTIECVDKVATKLFGLKISEESSKAVALRERLFSKDFVTLDGASRTRFAQASSFVVRASNKILAEDIIVDGKEYRAGLLLYKELLGQIDKSGRTSLKVMKDSKVYDLRKYSYNDNTLTPDELFTVINMYACTLDEFGQYDDQYELTSRILTSFETIALKHLKTNITEFTSNIASQLASTSEISKSSIMAIWNGLAKPDVKALVTELRSTDCRQAQQTDSNNLLALVAKENKVTNDYTGRASADMIKIQDSQRGRLDSIDSPESEMIGKVHFKTIHCKTDENGFITTPYIKIKNGVPVSDEPVYLSPSEERHEYIVDFAETFEADSVKAYYNGTIIYVPKEKVTYKDYSPFQAMSYAGSLLPFPNYSNPKRLLMGGNHLKQSIDIVKNERPLVSTGGDSLVPYGYMTAKDILGTYYDSREQQFRDVIRREEFIELPLVLKTTEIGDSVGVGYRNLIFNVTIPGKSIPEMITKRVEFFKKNSTESMFGFNINPKKSNTYRGDEVVVYNSGFDIRKYEKEMFTDYGSMKIDPSKFDKSLALGTNLLIGVKTMGSTTIDDAVTIRQGLCYENKLTSVSLKQIKCQLSKNDKFKEHFGFTGAVVPNGFTEQGLPVIGTYLKPGSLVVGIYRVYKDNNDKANHNTRVEPRNEKLDNNTSGEVVATSIVDGEAIVTLASIDPIEVGDKISGRCGNKDIIARAVPDNEMPFIESTGQVLDLVINPLGIPSRMNISQVIEAVLGLAMRKQGKVAIVSPYKENTIDFVRREIEKAGVQPEILVDGLTGERIKRPVTVGCTYVLKLEHKVKKKIHAINIPNRINHITHQPNKGKKNDGGQAFGEMESWVLMATGCNKILQDLTSIQSDDVLKQRNILEQIRETPGIVQADGESRNDLTVQVILRSMGVEVTNAPNGDYTFVPFTDDLTRKLTSGGPLNTRNEDSIYDTKVFGNTRGKVETARNRNRWGWIDLGCKIVHPYWAIKSSVVRYVIVKYVKSVKASGEYTGDTTSELTPLSNNKVKDILKRDSFVRPSDDYPILLDKGTKREPTDITGMEALVYLFENCNLEVSRKYYESRITKIKESSSANKDFSREAKTLGGINDWIKSNNTLKDVVISTYPVMPLTYRPEIKIENRELDFNKFYKQIFRAVNLYKSEHSELARAKIFDYISEFIGFRRDGNLGGSKKVSLLKYYAGHDKADKGEIRNSMLKKRLLFSGRSTIIPCQDPTMQITQVGLPILMGVSIWEKHLIALLKQGSPITSYCVNAANIDYKEIISAIASNNLFKFEKLVETHEDIEELFFKTRKFLVNFMEGKVVLLGRQPTLHKFSLRAYRVKITYTRAVEIHPLVCKGYNADFDGDQMYVVGLLTNEACEEAMEKLSAMSSIINPKDSSPIIEHAQDIRLGLYFATMLYDNKTTIEDDDRYNSIYHYNSVEAIRCAIETNVIQIHDLVSVSIEGRRYLSTAGRILFNDLIPDAFTTEKFSNVLNIPNINADRYYELKYDGLVAGKVPKKAEMKYIALTKVTPEVYLNYGIETATDVFQKLMEFGFFFSEMSGISLGFFDLIGVVDVQKYIDRADSYAKIVNDKFALGLLSEDGRKQALIDIYTKLTEYTQPIVLNQLPRNNNFFIIKDSGARGNDSQIMQTIGIVGVSMKTLNESLEIPITSCYAKGLSAMEMYLASYGARQGVSSTQNETSSAGYATRQSIFMCGGLKIVEEDCGNDNWTFELKYSDPCKVIKTVDGKPREFTGSRKELSKQLIGLHCDEQSEEFSMLIRQFLQMDGLMDEECVNIIFNNRIRHFSTKEAQIEIFYELDTMYEDLILHREARNLPFLRDDRFITPKTIQYIKDHNLESIEVRTMLNCSSVDGVCAHCFGLKFDNLKLPDVGEYVGFESGQSIGEPAAQLTMSLFHKGGLAGTSVSNGVEVFNSLLKGSIPSGDLKAILAPTDCYVEVSDLGETSILEYAGIASKQRTALVKVKDKEFVRLGQPLTLGFIDPDAIGKADNNPAVIRMRQLALLELYYKTFEQNDIKVHARHFEVLCKCQTSLVFVRDSDNPDLEIGKQYELGEVMKAMEKYPDSNVDYKFNISKQNDVISHFSGPFASLCFQNICENLSNAVVYRDFRQSNSPIGQVFIGENLTTHEHKKFEVPRFKSKQVNRVLEEVAVEEDKLSLKDILKSNETQADNLVEEFDFDLQDLLSETDLSNTENYSNTDIKEDDEITKTDFGSSKTMDLFDM